MNNLTNFLEELREYLEERADAEYFPDRADPVPNDEARLLAKLETLEASRQEQEKCVPEEPTDEMLEAAMSDRDRQHPANAKRYLRHVYKTMLQHLPPKKEQGHE